jgi:hypothetical protein
MSEELLQENQEQVPNSVDDIISKLRGFGIEDNEEILTIKASGKELKLRISNIPTEDEMLALLAVENDKGYLWVQKVKLEILSRAISQIDGINIRALNPKQRLVKDPTSTILVHRDIQVVLRNIIGGWGQEVVNILWKVLMVHSQKIEDRLIQSFPESSIMTEVEKRFFDKAMKEIEEINRAVISEGVDSVLGGEAEVRPSEEQKKE